MIDTFANGLPQIFPTQRKADSQKGTKWGEENVEAGRNLVDWELSSGVRKTKTEMARLYNLVNGIIDPSDKKNITNPLNLQGFDFPGTAQTYPLITPLLSVLTGEERNRVHSFSVSVVNHDAVSEKQNFLKQQLDKMIVQEIQNNSTSEEELQAKLQEFGQWSKFNYRDLRERMGHQLLTYLRRTQNLDFEFNRGFEDLGIVGEEQYIIDIIAGEPVMRKANPRNMTYVRSNESPYPEDSDIIIEDGYLSINKIIDEYHDELDEKQVKALEDGSKMNQSLSSKLFKWQNKSQEFDLNELVESQGGLGTLLGTPSKGAMFGLSGAYDKYGRARRTRVLWKSLRKIGILEYVDENGDPQKTVVPEQYTPNKERNEDVKWIWISEWWEGTELADGIFVKIQPRPVQFRESINLSKCSPGIVGIINNVNDSKITSFVSSLKPIQYLYDEFVYRLQTAFMTSYGNIARLDMSQIPDGWDMDKWLYYATVFKWAVQDPMKEGDEGAARGKLAGTMTQPSNSFMLDQGNLIQQNINMMMYLENRANDIAGITPQRKGATSSRETLGGIERAVVQSAHRTEKWFSLHDHVKVRVYRALLETAKAAYKDQKFKRSFFMDDMTQAVLDFDGSKFNEAEYGVTVNDSKVDTKIKNLLESSRDVLLQNGFQLSSVIDILRTDNLSSMQRKIEKKEEEMAQRREELEKAAIDQKREEAQLKAQSEEAERQVKERNNIRDNQTKLLLDKEPDNDNSLEVAKYQQSVQEHADKLSMDEKKLNETIRSNKANEQIKKTQKRSSNK